ncbi:hypothetical protein [Chryseobacterium taklimakanense]|uniref:hypothetical protein n=1 Tax=Chryseobacterium taklimakanense TaxID=536441 RepID=UPI0023F8CB98|nr:hypothetical protein [Chryseobacterium taklimakanense]
MIPAKTVLILGANSDVAKECVKKYLPKGFSVIMASRNLEAMKEFVQQNNLDETYILLKILPESVVAKLP